MWNPSVVNDDLLKASLLDLYEQAPAGYVFTAPGGEILRVNAAMERLTGYSADELTARRLQDLLTIGGKIFYENQYSPLLRMQGVVDEIAFDFVQPDGTRVPVLMNAVLRLDEAGQPALIAATVFSARSRRSYELELLQERIRADRLADVVRASIDAVVTCSPNGGVQDWNAAAERMFGHDADALRRLHLRDLLSFDRGTEYGGVMASLVAGVPVSVETSAIATDGATLDVSVSLTPHLDEVGSVDSISAIIRDVTERRAIERLQHEFLAMASHELRTPLAVIRGQSQVMRRRRSYSETHLDTIIDQTRRLARLIDDLLTASEMEADRFGLHVAEIDIVPMVRSVCRQFGSEEREIGVRTPDEAVVPVDRHRLEQALSNLLTNAVKYSSHSAAIEVSLHLDDREAAIEVTDHGMGIGPDDVSHLFERFYRAPNVVEHVKGTGLGLYITRRIMEAHGGRIDVTSDPGRGSTFALRFPVTIGCKSTAVPAQ